MPRPFTVAPPNTHVWLFAPPDWDQRICDLEAGQGEKPVCHQGPFGVKLFHAPTRATSRAQPLPADVRVFRNSKNAVVELVPCAALISGRRYDVPIVDARGSEVRLASTFRVGGKADKDAPSFQVTEPPKPPKAIKKKAAKKAKKVAQRPAKMSVKKPASTQHGAITRPTSSSPSHPLRIPPTNSDVTVRTRDRILKLIASGQLEAKRTCSENPSRQRSSLRHARAGQRAGAVGQGNRLF